MLGGPFKFSCNKQLGLRHRCAITAAHKAPENAEELASEVRIANPPEQRVHAPAGWAK
jgi:hypothetical protein